MVWDSHSFQQRLSLFIHSFIYCVNQSTNSQSILIGDTSRKSGPSSFKWSLSVPFLSLRCHRSPSGSRHPSWQHPWQDRRGKGGWVLRAHVSCVTFVMLLPGSDPPFMLIILRGSIFYSHFAGHSPSRPGLGHLAVSSVHSRCVSSPTPALSGAEFPSGVWLPHLCAPGLLWSPGNSVLEPLHLSHGNSYQSHPRELSAIFWIPPQDTWNFLDAKFKPSLYLTNRVYWFCFNVISSQSHMGNVASSLYIWEMKQNSSALGFFCTLSNNPLIWVLPKWTFQHSWWLLASVPLLQSALHWIGRGWPLGVDRRVAQGRKPVDW